MLHQALGLFDDHFGHLYVAGGGFVEGGGDHLALHRPLHVGDFLWAFVHQEHDQVAFGMIGGDRLGDVLHHDGLAHPRRRDDQAALALAEGRDDVDDAAGAVLQGRIVDLHGQPLVRVERGQVIEMDLVADVVGALEINRVDLQYGEVALAFSGRTHRAFHRVAGLETHLADLRGGAIDIVRPWQVIGFGGAEEAEAVLKHFQGARA